MKNLLSLFLLFFLAGALSCNPMEGDGSKGKRKGETKFDPDAIRDIDLSAIKKKVEEASRLENCAKYKSARSVSASIFGKYSAAAPIQNCIAKIMDEGLEPVCKKERELEELAEEHKNNQSAVEDIESMRDEVALLKEEISEILYVMADAFDETHSDIEDEIDGWSSDSALERLFSGMARVGTSSELGGTVRFVERRARKICFGNFSFDKAKDKKLSR